MTETGTDTGTLRVVGIDLGTTNSALAWGQVRTAVRIFDVPQLIAAGEVGRQSTLPSFLYLPTESEVAAGIVSQPWSHQSASAIAGVFARDHGGLSPARLVSSAKSWLANPSVDRTAALLPWGSDDGPRMSPVDASARLLSHLRDVWDHEFARADERFRLAAQSIVLTVPASFDEEARELTVDAARRAGFTRLRLLEEPLAALYAWIAQHRRTAKEQVASGALVLVCDVGGGTADFSLIRTSEEQGDLRFERIAIGEHLLLGGDNLDLALAALAEQKLTAAGSAKLTLTQRQILRRKCSAAKERLLSEDAPGEERITILGSGRSIVAGGVTVTLTRDEIVRALIDGFLPVTDPNDLPARDRRVGLRELGLPYETEPAITKHLAAFLARAARPDVIPERTGRLRPDVVLFNGGFFTPAIARTRVLDALQSWFGERPIELENERPETAVAIGAAFYGRLREDPAAAQRLLIRAGSARAYYAGVQGAEAGRVSAVAVMPRGTQEGTSIDIDREFSVITNEPLAFTLYSSTARSDPPGVLVNFTDADDVHRHAPLVTAFRFGKRSRRVPIGVRLRVTFTETGTLELWCDSRSTDHRWRLSFNLRGAEADPLDDLDDEDGGEDQVLIDDARTAQAAQLIRSVFAPEPTAIPPEALVGELENVLGHPKQAWPLSVIRTLADALLDVQAGRRRSPAFEIRWLNLIGFCTRPGFGSPLDEWRVSELRKVYSAGLVFPKETQCQVEWLVLWQRVGAGFKTGQQRELAQRVSGQLGIGQRKPSRINPQIEREGWRLLGSLERLDPALRTRLGDQMVERVRREPRHGAWAWTLSRLGARIPLYGPLSSVVPPSTAARWIERLLTARTITSDLAHAIVQVGALTADPARDVPDELRQQAIVKLIGSGVGRDEVSPLATVVAKSGAETVRAFGESLPEGLRLDSAQPVA